MRERVFYLEDNAYFLLNQNRMYIFTLKLVFAAGAIFKHFI